jgi:hypothetical protein
MILRLSLFLFMLFSAAGSIAADKVVLVTLDGLRWQELFTGIDETLLNSLEFTKSAETLNRDFWDDAPEKRAQKLMPFMHGTVFEQGAFVGDLRHGSCAEVSNRKNFSYPGYSEILTGFVDHSITSNDKVPNANKNFMELLYDNTEKDKRFHAAAFTSWDVFPAILNVDRSGLYVNAFGPLEVIASDNERRIQEFYFDTPRPWTNVRNDVFTHRYALEYLEREQPDVLFISYGETDDFAHDGKYHEYIWAANRTDRFIGEVWATLQRLDAYHEKTTLFITTDHGRGQLPLESWQHHSPTAPELVEQDSLLRYAQGIAGEEAVWMAAIGPDINTRGEIITPNGCLTSNRIAATLLHTLGIDFRTLNPNMGAPLREFLR